MSEAPQPTKTVLIAGAGGFLGGWAGRAFADAGWRVIGIDRRAEPAPGHPAGARFWAAWQDDLSDAEQLSEKLGRVRPAVVVHLAGPADVRASFDRPVADFHAQVDPLLVLLEAIRLSGSGARLLLASSAAVYGDPDALPVRASCAPRPISPYGFHKLQQELIAETYHRIYGIGVCKARVFSTYGEGLRRLAVWDITRRLLAGERTIRGTGQETRDFLHAEDVGSAFVTIAERSSFRGEAVNVASGTETKIEDLAEMICRESGAANEKVRHEEQSETGLPTRWKAEVGELREMGFQPVVGLADGIRRTVRWIRDQS